MALQFCSRNSVISEAALGGDEGNFIYLTFGACFFLFYCYIRQEKDGLLSEAVKSFNGALAMDRNQQTAKDHLEKIQLQINLKKEVGGDTYFIFTYFLQSIFPRDTAKRVFQRNTLKRKPRNILNLSNNVMYMQPNDGTSQL